MPPRAEKEPRIFRNFSEQSRKALQQAVKEAKSLGDVAVRVDHIALGILGAPEGNDAQRKLSELHVDQLQLRNTLLSQMTHEKISSDPVEITPAAKRVIELAAEEPSPRGAVTTIHMMIAVLREGTSVTAKALEEHGVTLTNVEL